MSNIAVTTKQVIAITPGEPAGIGPDLVIMAAQQEWPAEIIAIADPELLLQRAQLLELPLDLVTTNVEIKGNWSPGRLKVLPVEQSKPTIAGQLNLNNAKYVLDTLSIACQGCIDRQFSALVTAPVHKGIINQAGYPFTGHTEFLAEHTGGHCPVMMLSTPGLRVALATTHIPLSAVSQTINSGLIEQVLSILINDLAKYFKLDNPRIAVCGLNPHAGEGGYLGREEIESIQPVIEQFKQQGQRISGAYPADTLFVPEKLAQFDAVLAMYHDQGLPVLKHLGFGQAVNITLGLPIIRTSVDHGTALELAATGKAKVSSLNSAITYAIDMAQNQSHLG